MYTNRHIPHDMQDSQPKPASARALRQSLKETQANNPHLRLYLQLGQQLLINGWNVSTASSLLC